MLKKLKDPKPQFFVVWTSVYGTDNLDMAREGASILRDPRVKNYYEAKPKVVMDFGKLVELPRDAPLAYDVYFLYDGKTEWKNTPPKPHEWWHQVIDGPKFLDANDLKIGIEKLLKAKP
ncbi:MAG TPA: hypothetical protein PLX06_04330 [Fimbriimonadaceae bacterium]|nr:hypothetical protein [Fimbriimonadaceae bacterium]